MHLGNADRVKEEGGAVRPSWRLVWALATAQLISWGTLYYAFAVIALPMQRELGWSKIEVNGALSLGLLISGACALPVGGWIDRHGGRLLMTAGSVAGGLLLFAWGRVDGLTAFYLIWALIGMVLAVVLYDPVFTVVTLAYGADYRRAILLITLVGGFASTVFIPLTQALVDHLGWRTTLDLLALFNLLPAAGIHFFGLAGVGSPAGAPRVTEGLRHCEKPLRRALATPTFWGLLASFAAYSITFSALTFHLIPLLSERGVQSGTIISCMAIIGPMQVLGRIALLGVGAKGTADRVGRLNALALPAAILLLALLPSQFWTIAVFAGLYGLGNGVMTIVRGTAVPDLLGSAGYGKISGALSLPANIAKAAAPFAAAALWGFWQSYEPVLWVLFAVAIVSAVGFWTAVAAAQPSKQLS